MEHIIVCGLQEKNSLAHYLLTAQPQVQNILVIIYKSFFFFQSSVFLKTNYFCFESKIHPTFQQAAELTSPGFPQRSVLPVGTLQLPPHFQQHLATLLPISRRKDSNCLAVSKLHIYLSSHCNLSLCTNKNLCLYPESKRHDAHMSSSSLRPLHQS